MDFEKLKTDDSVIVARFAIIAEFFVLYFDFHILETMSGTLFTISCPRDNLKDTSTYISKKY